MINPKKLYGLTPGSNILLSWTDMKSMITKREGAFRAMRSLNNITDDMSFRSWYDRMNARLADGYMSGIDAVANTGKEATLYGMIFYRCRDSKPIGEIECLYAKPEIYHQMAGKLLWRASAHLVLRHGITALEMISSPCNEKEAELLSNHGWQNQGVVPCTTDVVYCKQIKPAHNLGTM